MRRYMRHLSVTVSVLIVLAFGGGPQVPVVLGTVPPGCPKLGETQRAYERGHFTYDQNGDGALAAFQLRSISSPDWEAGGFAASTLWLLTDGGTGEWWVEVGVSSSWDTLDGDTFYSADWAPGLAYRQREFSTLAPVLNHDVEFKIIHASNGDMKASVTDRDTDVQVIKLWGGHSGPFPEHAMGGEGTCPPGGGSTIDKEWVYNNEYRHVSDNVWEHPEHGTLEHDQYGMSYTDSAWCVGNYYFRFWMHDLSNAGCS